MSDEIIGFMGLLALANKAPNEQAYREQLKKTIGGLYELEIYLGKSPEEARQSQLDLLVSFYHAQLTFANGLLKHITGYGHPNAFTMFAKGIIGVEPEALLSAFKEAIREQQRMYVEIARECGIDFPIREEPELYLEDKIRRQIEFERRQD